MRLDVGGNTARASAVFVSTSTLEQLADRLAIKELVAAYAYCADRRDAAGQMGQFTL